MSATRRERYSPLLTALLALIPAGIIVGIVGCPPPPPDGNENTNSVGNSGLTGKFVGSARCSVCHSNVHSDWSQTLHAHAYETLEAIGQQSNADCVGCHTVGYGQPGGWVDRKTTNDLAGVGCESCHGPGGDHANNVNDESLRPPTDISATVCGQCHTGSNQPQHDDWLLSRHAQIQPSLVTDFAAGKSADSCGKCHSGDAFFLGAVKGQTVPANLLAGKTADEMNAITCSICHNPHARTGNAAQPDDGRDFQLRYEQIKYTTPSTVLADVVNPERFNLCGQCHHSRERVWTDSSREPHPSDQVNVFFGELPVPDSHPEPIVAVRASVHLNTAEQCSTCHVFRKSATDVSPTVSGHTFEVNFDACAECHGSRDAGEAKLAALKIEVDQRADLLEEALKNWGLANDIEGKGALSWEYTSEGGPGSSGQTKIPDAIKKARYIFYYVVAGGGNGAHNPDFVRDALITALAYAKDAPPRLP